MPTTTQATMTDYDPAHPLYTVATSAATYREMDQEASTKRQERNEAIRTAWSHGATVAEVCRLADLGSDSVYSLIEVDSNGGRRRTGHGQADDLEALSRAVEALARAEQTAEDARATRDAAIRAAAKAGLPKVRIGEAAKVTRRTVYHVIEHG